LLDHFGTIDKLKAASAAALCEVPGIGDKFARDLHAFLRGKAAPSGES
jgi:ERCC4-type nuclease